MRVGYKRKPKGPDWSIDGEYLVWNRKGGIRIHTVEADPHYFSDKDAKLKRRAINFALQITTRRLPRRINSDVRELILGAANYWKITDYFEAGSRVLANDQFSDAEKMLFLNRVTDLQGFRYGEHVSRLLSKVKWTSSSLLDRWAKFVELTETRTPEWSAEISVDDAIVQGLPERVVMFRGFNVPHKSSIRDPLKWKRQEFGAGPYYSLSKFIALGFACRQKMALGRRQITHNDLTKAQRELFEGKIVVAEYAVPRDAIIAYNHALVRLESECICRPKSVTLRRYEFFGGEKCLAWQQRDFELRQLITSTEDGLNNEGNARITVALQTAFMSF